MTTKIATMYSQSPIPLMNSPSRRRISGRLPNSSRYTRRPSTPRPLLEPRPFRDALRSGDHIDSALGSTVRSCALRFGRPHDTRDSFSMICPNCGAENAVGQKFCGDCGHSLGRTCPSCGTPYPEGRRFCGECGTALTQAATAPAEPRRAGPDDDARVAERRLVTVLFADLVGFTPFAEERDAEDTREM